MYPILLNLGPLTLHTYGLFIATAFLVSLSFAAHEGNKEGIDPKFMYDLCFYILIATIVGARAMFIFVELDHFRSNPSQIFKIWEGGLVFYGGFIASVLVAIFYLKKHNLNYWQVGDILALALALGQGIGRWGCFFAGCCFGKPTDVPWAIMFTNPDSLAPQNIHLHPTQIYDSLNGFLIFAVLLLLKKRKKFHGQIFWLYTLFYAIGRFIIENYRGDNRGVLVPNTVFSTSQIIGIALAAISLFMLYKLRKPVHAREK